MADWDWQSLGADTPGKLEILRHLVISRHVPFDCPDKERYNIIAIKIAARRTARHLERSDYFGRVAVFTQEEKAERERSEQVGRLQEQQGVARLRTSDGNLARKMINRSVPIIERTIAVHPYRSVYRFFENTRERAESKLIARLYRSRPELNSAESSVTHG